MTDTLPTEFLFITDPGHGWLVVTVDDVNAVGLSILEFSSFSFIENGVLFLEEDCDATLFVLAYHATMGRKPEFRFRDVEHFERHRERLPGTGYTFEGNMQKCRALDLLIASAKLANPAGWEAA